MEHLETKRTMRNAGIFFFLLMVMEIPMSVFVGGFIAMLPVKFYFLASVLVTQGYLLLFAILYILMTKTKLSTDLGIHKFRISTFFLSLLVLVASAPMAIWLNAFSQLFVKNEMAGNIFEMTEVLPAWLSVIIIGCLPGFVEELIYRGIMFSAFKKRSVLTGILVSALSFGLMHMNLNQIPYAIYIGIVFAVLVEVTGSLISSMILHMLFNAVNTLYLYILPVLYKFMGRYSKEYANVDLNEMMARPVAPSEIWMMLLILMPFAVGGIALTVLLLKQIAKMNGKSLTWKSLCGEKEEVKAAKPVSVFLILGWMFCIGMAIGNMVLSI